MRKPIVIILAVVLTAAVAGGLMLSQSNADIDLSKCCNPIQGVTALRDAYPLGESVKLMYAIRNRGDEPLEYQFSSGKQFDIWITRGPKEIWRLSKNRVYTQALTSLTLQPGETKTFEVEWNQVNNEGEKVGPGVYEVYAQLTPMGEAPPEVKSKVKLGEVSAAVVPVEVAQLSKRSEELMDRRVRIDGVYRGWKPDPSDPLVIDGPPVTRSDWAVCDDTGCIYVTGRSGLDPMEDVGRQIVVVGKLQKAASGQLYLIAESVEVQGQ